MKNTRKINLPSRFVLAIGGLLLLTVLSYSLAPRSAYAAACVSSGSNNTKLAVATI